MKFLVGKDGLVVNIVSAPVLEEGEKLWLVDDADTTSVGDAFDDKARQVDDVAVAVFQVLFRHENMIRQLVRAVRTNAQISTAATTAGLPTTANAPDLTLAQAKAAFKNLIP